MESASTWIDTLSFLALLASLIGGSGFFLLVLWNGISDDIGGRWGYRYALLFCIGMCVSFLILIQRQWQQLDWGIVGLGVMTVGIGILVGIQLRTGDRGAFPPPPPLWKPFVARRGHLLRVLGLVIFIIAIIREPYRVLLP